MVICGELSFLRIFCLSLLSEFAWTLWSECRWCRDMNNKVVLKCRRDVTVCMNFLELECGWQCDMDVMITLECHVDLRLWEVSGLGVFSLVG